MTSAEVVEARHDVEGLPAPVALAQQRLADEKRIEGRDEGADRKPVDRRRGDQREFAHAGQGELERARDRRGRERQHVDLGAQLLQALLVADAEMLLLVDDDEAEILELDGLAEQRMGADDDVDRAVREALLDLLHLGGGHEARGLGDVERQAAEAVAEGLVVLAGQQRRRHDDRDLLAVHGGHEGGPQRDLRLAEAHIAADEPVHRAARSEIVENGIDGVLLVLGLVVGEAGRELVVEPFRRHEARRLLEDARRGDLHERARHLADALLHARLARLPGAAAEPVELDLGLLRPVAGQELDVLHRQEEAVAAGIMEFEAVMRRARRLDGLQALEAADAVIDMHHEIARRERRDLGQEILRPLGLALLAHQPVAEDVLLADDREIAGLEAGFQSARSPTGISFRG